jgi:pimeloyl-ACP methyl ester carboxylesterase
MQTWESSRVSTDRLDTHVWTSGPQDGVPLLLVHGNLVSGGWWRYVAAALPDDVRVIAPDLRGFGRSEARPIDATRGLGDMVDDVRSLLVALGWADRGVVNAAGWSMGGGVLWQYAVAYPDDLASMTMIAPVSPYGYGGTKGNDGTPCFADFAGSGGGGAAPEFVRRLAAGDRSEDDPATSPRVIMREYFGPRTNTENVDEEFLLDESLRTTVGEDFYPGDSTPSGNWPGLAPGTRGVLNAMTPKYYRATEVVDLKRKPPISWLRGGQDQVISDTSMFDFGYLGQIGAVPGWPGEDALPPQPMVAQTRAVLDAYRAGGGVADEITFENAAHGMLVEVPEWVAEVIADRLVGERAPGREADTASSETGARERR